MPLLFRRLAGIKVITQVQPRVARLAVRRAFNLPFKDKALMAKVSCKQSPGIASIALSMASAIARSKRALSLGKSAGVRLIIIRLGGKDKDKLYNADLMRFADGFIGQSNDG